MDEKSFFNIEKKNKYNSIKKVTMPLMEAIVQVKFRKAQRDIFFKTVFIQEEFVKCDFLINKFSVEDEGLKIRGCLQGIPEQKREGILHCHINCTILSTTF